jgi:hypothetical protein
MADGPDGDDRRAFQPQAVRAEFEACQPDARLGERYPLRCRHQWSVIALSRAQESKAGHPSGRGWKGRAGQAGP